MSLVANITNILREQGHPDPSAWTQHEYIQIVEGVTGFDERLYVNRYWREFLSNLVEDTMSTRFFLRDETSDEAYLETFATMVAPVIIKNSKN